MCGTFTVSGREALSKRMVRSLVFEIFSVFTPHGQFVRKHNRRWATYLCCACNASAWWWVSFEKASCSNVLLWLKWMSLVDAMSGKVLTVVCILSGFFAILVTVWSYLEGSTLFLEETIYGSRASIYLPWASHFVPVLYKLSSLPPSCHKIVFIMSV